MNETDNGGPSQQLQSQELRKMGTIKDDEKKEADGVDAVQLPRGLQNVGNTCYANAALQCLLSTAVTNALLDPQVVRIFRRYSSNPNLLSLAESTDTEDDGTITTQIERELLRKEKEKKRMQDSCDWLTLELTQLTQEYTAPVNESATAITNDSYFCWLSSSDSPYPVLDPGRITKHPDRLSKCLSPYQQEDAHEFLRALLTTLGMNGRNKQLSSLFDGLLESAVVCQTCGNQRVTRDRYMDLSLDINDLEISTLNDALFEYTRLETLDDDNAVYCPKCDEKQCVTKCLRMATAPSVLVCHLKRFAINSYGQMQRLDKKITVPTQLEIGDYMSNLNQASPPPYDLVGILVHQGHTCASGHYLAYVKRNGQWYLCNDSVVKKVDEATALDQQAYILMYEVANMRAKTCGTVGDTRDQNTRKGGQAISQRKEQHPPSDSLWQILCQDGVSPFFTEVCGESYFSKRSMQEASRHRSRSRRRHRTRRRNSASSADASLIGLSLKFDRKKKSNNGGSRSSTAPRQRPDSDGYNPRMSSLDSSRKKSTRSRSKTRRDGHNNKKLPPLPSPRSTHRRSKSNGAIQSRRYNY